MLDRLIFAFRPSPVRTACSTHFSLITGNMPGMPASTKDTCEFGSAPNSVEAPENSLDLDRTWAWTSRPITTSQSPVCPLINLDGIDLDTGALMGTSTSWRVCAENRRPARWQGPHATPYPRRTPCRSVEAPAADHCR